MIKENNTNTWIINESQTADKSRLSHRSLDLHNRLIDLYIKMLTSSSICIHNNYLIYHCQTILWSNFVPNLHLEQNQLLMNRKSIAYNLDPNLLSVADISFYFKDWLLPTLYLVNWNPFKLRTIRSFIAMLLSNSFKWPGTPQWPACCIEALRAHIYLILFHTICKDTNSINIGLVKEFKTRVDINKVQEKK